MVDVYVIGGTLPALAAALEMAEVGLQVRIALATSATASAGLNPRGELDPEGTLAGFLTHLAEPIAERGPASPGVAPVRAEPVPVQLRKANGAWALQPMPAVWGIPAVPMATQAIALLGGAAVARASLDRIKPVLTIGKTHELGALVRNRMGRAVEQRLVDPLVREHYGVGADEVEVALAAPGFNEALTLAGSLSGAALAYNERFVARETRVAPTKGWSNAEAVLIERLRLYDVQFSEQAIDSVRYERDSTSAGGAWSIGEQDGAPLKVRAVVIDPEATVPESLAEHLAPLAPKARRVGVRAQISEPDFGDAEHPALQTVEREHEEFWSLRTLRDAHSQWWAELVGPRVTEGDAVRDRDNTEATASQALEVFEAAGLRAIAAPAVTMRVAPYVSVEHRDAEAAMLTEQREATPTLLPVGSALHGGDVATAVGDARSAAVALRRRLLGIAD